MTWLRNNAVAIASALLASLVGAASAYAATEARIAVLEEKVLPIDEVRDNVLILCTHLRAPCRERR